MAIRKLNLIRSYIPWNTISRVFLSMQHNQKGPPLEQHTSEKDKAFGFNLFPGSTMFSARFYQWHMPGSGMTHRSDAGLLDHVFVPAGLTGALCLGCSVKWLGLCDLWALERLRCCYVRTARMVNGEILNLLTYNEWWLMDRRGSRSLFWMSQHAWCMWQ